MERIRRPKQTTMPSGTLRKGHLVTKNFLKKIEPWLSPGDSHLSPLKVSSLYYKGELRKMQKTKIPTMMCTYSVAVQQSKLKFASRVILTIFAKNLVLPYFVVEENRLHRV